MHRTLTTCVAAAALLAGCTPRPVPIMKQGQMLPNTQDAVIARANAEGNAELRRLEEERGAAQAAALASCEPAVCAAITRGEVMLGMNTDQVLAATRSTPDGWDIRGTAAARVMGPRTGASPPRDAVGELAQVSIQNGRVTGYTYRETQGFRSVTAPADATARGRAEAQAAALLEEGDRAVASGNVNRALDLFDRADILRPNHADTQLRIARILEQQQRPLEAAMRYRLFIHHLEIDRIRARGEAAARMAEAIALAQQRIIVLERQR
jgi:tetratricopeptide (TPR) repeat protein